MPDGSGKPHIEADQAAADAAREARAEVLERLEAEKRGTAATAHTTPGGNAIRRRGRTEWHEFTVNVWITNFNSVEFGFWKRERNRGKSRQFTADMDIFAEVIEGGQRTGLLGYREDLWKKSSGMDKRLVFKLFGEKLNWHASMDMMLGRSLQLTLGARGFPVTAYALNVGNHEQVVQLERSALKWPFMPEDFSFTVIDDGKPVFYRLRQHFIDLGGDYTLYDQHDKVIGKIDGKVFSIGGKWYGRVKKDSADPRLLMVLKLFCGSLVFHRDCRQHLKELHREIRAGRLVPKLQKQEADLYMNPRRVR
jgi:hypothetical protein